MVDCVDVNRQMLQKRPDSSENAGASFGRETVLHEECEDISDGHSGHRPGQGEDSVASGSLTCLLALNPKPGRGAREAVFTGTRWTRPDVS